MILSVKRTIWRTWCSDEVMCFIHAQVIAVPARLKHGAARCNPPRLRPRPRMCRGPMRSRVRSWSGLAVTWLTMASKGGGHFEDGFVTNPRERPVHPVGEARDETYMQPPRHSQEPLRRLRTSPRDRGQASVSRGGLRRRIPALEHRQATAGGRPLQAGTVAGCR